MHWILLQATVTPASDNWILNLVTSVGTVSVVGIIFFMWLNSKFQNLEREIDSCQKEIERVDKDMKDMVDKDDYKTLRVEDKESMEKVEQRLEKRILELANKVENMPNQIVNQLKIFMNK